MKIITNLLFLFLVNFYFGGKLTAQVEIINQFGVELDTSKSIKIHDELSSLIHSSDFDTLRVKIVVNYILNESYSDKIDILPSLTSTNDYYFILVINIGHSEGNYQYHFNLPDSLGSCRTDLLDNLILMEKQQLKVWTPDNVFKNVLDAIHVFNDLCSTNNDGDIYKQFYEYMDINSFIPFNINSVVRDTGIVSFPNTQTTGIINLIRFSNMTKYKHNSAGEIVISTYISSLNDQALLDGGADVYVVDQLNLKLFLKLVPLTLFETPSSKLRIILFVNDKEDLVYMKSFPVPVDENPAFRQGAMSTNSSDDVFDKNGLYLTTIKRNIAVECERNSILIQQSSNSRIRLDSIPSGGFFSTWFYLSSIMRHYWMEEYPFPLRLNGVPIFIAEGHGDIDTVGHYGYNIGQKIVMPYELNTGKLKTINKYAFLSVIVHENRHFERGDSEKGFNCNNNNAWYSDSSHVCDVFYYQLGRVTRTFGGKYLSDLMCGSIVDGHLRSTARYLERHTRNVSYGWGGLEAYGGEDDKVFFDFIKSNFIKHNVHKLKYKYTVFNNYNRYKAGLNPNAYEWPFYYKKNNINLSNPLAEGATLDDCDK